MLLVVDAARIDELVRAARIAAITSDPSDTVDELDRALAEVTDSKSIGHLLLARAIAQQGVHDIRLAADDSRASAQHLLEAGDNNAAAFALASAAGMVQRTGDMAGALDLAVEAMVLLPDHDLNDEHLVRAANAMAMLFAQCSAFELAAASSRRAVQGAMELPDRNTRSIVSYTHGYCVVEAIRSAQYDAAQHAEFEADLDHAVKVLNSPNAGVVERAILGSGMQAEQALITDDRSSLTTALAALEAGRAAQPAPAARLGAWHQLVTATVLRNLGRPQEAEVLLDDAVPVLVEVGDEHRIVRAFNERSTTRALNGDLLGALDDARETARLTRHWQQFQGARLATQISRRAELQQARASLRHRADELAKQASEDAVTGLATRRWLEMRLDELTRTDQMGTVIVLDLDRFKKINDTFGHQTGDVVLREVGRLFRDVVRTSTPVARFGGEEFVILLPGLDHADGMALAERVRATINDFDWNAVATGLVVTISAGVTHGSLVGARELLRLADTALYDAKRAGRNRVVSL